MHAIASESNSFSEVRPLLQIRLQKTEVNCHRHQHDEGCLPVVVLFFKVPIRGD